jgi:hypothetical protein
LVSKEIIMATKRTVKTTKTKNGADMHVKSEHGMGAAKKGKGAKKGGAC